MHGLAGPGWGRAPRGSARVEIELAPQRMFGLSKDALFDIGADTVGLLVPGGSIAVKVARAAVDRDY